MILIKMKCRLTYLVFFSLLFTCVSAQNRNNIWYFGDKAGIDFNNNSINLLTNSNLIHTEGVASICDEFGDLEFYTNGINVWNANNQIMPNGTGLQGNNSSSQVLIVPKPGDCTRYYIFTTPAQSDESNLSFSEVDMTLQGGLGDVIAKNTPLALAVTEKVCATLKSNNFDYWVVSQSIESNKFYSYSITSAGVSTVPVISEAGTNNTLQDAVGNLKFSPSGNKMVVTNELGHKNCQLFDFDIATGVVSNAITLQNTASYGAEFSPNGNYLYVAGYTKFDLYQYNITLGNATAIIGSKFEIVALNNERGGAMQLAPNGRIYICRADKAFLDEIANPNGLAGTCAYNANALNLMGRNGLAGLPNFIKKYSPANNCGKLLAKYEKQTCGNIFKITLKATFGIPPYTYSLDAVNYQNSPIFLNQQPGAKTGYAKDAAQNLKQVEFNIQEGQVAIIKNIEVTKNSICGIKDGKLQIITENTTEPVQYTLDGVNFTANNNFSGLRDSMYTVTIKDASGCILTETISIESLNPPKVYAGPDTFVFIGNDAILKAIDVNNSGFNRYEWQPNYNVANQFLQNTSALVDKDVEYTIIAKNTVSGCQAIDKIIVRVVTDADIYIPNSFTPNNDGLNDLLRPLPIGITTFKYLNIYNRFGKLVFSTTLKNGFWDGKINGVTQNSGTYVFVTEGIDYKGRKVYKKGTINLVR
jgi:gliding motility-associated-like protein